MAASASAQSPWLSINDMLIQNRCWLCREVFPKGRTKKVFQITHLTDYFKKRHELEKETTLPPIESPHLRDTYARYVELLQSSSPESFLETLMNELRQQDVEIWMSGLTCDLLPLCQREVRLFLDTLPPVDDNAASEPSIVTTKTESDKKKMDVMKMMTFANCPPGCDCDNPWPFLS